MLLLLVSMIIAAVLVETPLTQTAHLDRVLRSAARLIGTPKYVPISGYVHDTLHWLLIQQLIFYRAAVLLWHYLLGIAPVYLQELCCPVSALAGLRALRCSAGGKLLVSPCKNLDYAVSCILSCCSFYLKFTSLTDSIVTKSYTFALQTA